MNDQDRVYDKLQRHLNRQPVGFPATRGRAEIRILKHVFTPQEAEVACCLSYRPEPLETIFSRVGQKAGSRRTLERILDRMHAKGGIESRMVEGAKQYANLPLAVGIYEYQVGRLTPEFLRDFDAYTSTLKFGIEFLSTGLPQMRTIPVHRSIQPQHHVSTFDEVTSLLNGATGPFVILECICRKKRSIEGAACRVTGRAETCLAIGDLARPLLQSDSGREVPRAEALSLLELNQKEGLVLQPSNTREADFICSCCGCCCGMLRLQQRLPKPLDFWVSNFRARVESAACTGCGVCEKRCQVGAIHLDQRSGKAVIAPDRCIGCGVCVPTCPAGAVALIKKSVETRPPRSRQDLYDAIMARKKGRLAKVGLTTKILADAVRTGQLHRLRTSSK